MSVRACASGLPVSCASMLRELRRDWRHQLRRACDQQAAALGRRQLAPGAGIEGGARRLHRGVDVGGRAARDLLDDFAGRRVDHRQRLAARARRPAAVDEVLFHERTPNSTSNPLAQEPRPGCGRAPGWKSRISAASPLVRDDGAGDTSVNAAPPCKQTRGEAALRFRRHHAGALLGGKGCTWRGVATSRIKR